jgi:transitional endoplasmic reticulum ATPase
LAIDARLQIFGRVDLDGTHRSIIEANIPQLEQHLEQSCADGTCALELSGDSRSCGCLLAEYRRADEGRIFVDRFKQWHLGLKDGDEVAVAVLDPPFCEQLELVAPPDFSDRDAVRFIGKPLIAGEKTALYSFSGESRSVTVADVRPPGIALVTPATEIRLTGARTEETPVSYDDIGGLEREIKQIREVVEFPFRFGEVFKYLGVSPPRGIILHGPPGTGKTLIARALANEVGARFYSISGPEVYSKWYGKSEQNLRNIFEEAVKNAPAVVVIDELDALVPRREQSHGDQEQRIVATFLTQMDGLRELKDVVVVGTTNRIDAIDPALRRGGRFELEIPIGAPDTAGREEIRAIHSRRMPLGDDVDLAAIARHATGFVGADLASLCREAAYNSLRRSFPDDAFESGHVFPHEGLHVSHDDFVCAARSVPPSAAKELATDVPRVGWDDIGGLDDIEQLLVENITYGITRRADFERLGIEPATGILLHGPPGTGKTLLARAVASECGANFVTVRGPELRSRWIGESEQRVRFLFDRARALAPCVLFFDEIDAILPVRGRELSGSIDSMINQLLAEMDGVDQGAGVFVIGATNRLDALDPAALRPGRFDFQVEVPLPDAPAREAIFAVHLRGKPVAADVRAPTLAEATAGFSGAEIAEACREAAWNALRDAEFDAEQVEVTRDQLQQAVERVRSLRNGGTGGR